MKVKVGQHVPLTIKRLGINGEGVGYFKKQVVFVPGALPNEEVIAEITNVKHKFAEGRVKRIRKMSDERVKAPCPIYEKCGGCQLQHLSYEGQLRAKRDIVVQAFERHGNVRNLEKKLEQTIGMEEPWKYRNKAQFQVGLLKGKVIAGLYGANSHRLININECIVQRPETTKVINNVKQILQDLKISIYDERKRKGLVRTIVTRIGVSTGEVQLVLITSKEELPKKDLLIQEVKKRLPEVKSIMQNVNGQKTSLIFGDKTFTLDGKETIEEVLGDLSFDLSARAFFQLNPTQTVKLYNEVKKEAGLTGKEKIVDAYCGVGTIGLWLADEAGEIRGMDVIEDSIVDANKNAKAKGYDNAHYVVGKAEYWMPKWVKEGWKPDVIVIDPPRTGCDEKLLKTILDVKPKKVVYVSCNPSTLAKDVKILTKLYKVERIQPVDMFPQTAHVESVTTLSLK
ncbi:23S rRNA (uracil(1939)-C(5))-methyltransferase RlmD [Priestia filamentosa]|uniref:23S rRNA (Uracil-5-)-methyltransferase RumA n=1 Tax=Priestia filamentosa TaxID=1402861 RepID=A0A0H4KMZ2_9BACI|nr:23S rRNA (uracil(1939)-C(5))-methyltransferase RlmD [Priestia filamentosa]AKO94935.1 23S rRNA (uracil-5-)-methyltransferase RumA [Priestia filamentosa]MDT3765588.1 23S rRNA (uracil(1939)-C(5))-methyltransferase RlmD [Priestia filamentosa]OXS66339.1 23S rRNA (uracil-5-)-methyltransferase RumA [Priestia filamentosa]RJS67531.1 23S rRNA (uracil(1939)-C(5))-methyltransferase RlmD [Priestia filamentosa]WCM17793.1 23S rRNA (uracil(1939)-C(5))-methyltransferase RlmD [Priestia filamentosa]